MLISREIYVLTGRQVKTRLAEIALCAGLVWYVFYCNGGLPYGPTLTDVLLLGLAFQGIALIFFNLYDLIGHLEIKRRSKRLDDLPPALQRLEATRSGANESRLPIIAVFAIFSAFIGIILVYLEGGSSKTWSDQVSFACAVGMAAIWIPLSWRRRFEMQARFRKGSIKFDT